MTRTSHRQGRAKPLAIPRSHSDGAHRRQPRLSRERPCPRIAARGLSRWWRARHRAPGGAALTAAPSLDLPASSSSGLVRCRASPFRRVSVGCWPWWALTDVPERPITFKVRLLRVSTTTALPAQARFSPPPTPAPLRYWRIELVGEGERRRAAARGERPGARGRERHRTR
jgi:hypothetical protein